MCGILVVVAKRAGGLDLPACRRALASMHWRGPDATFAHVWDNRVFLGQTVLSVTGTLPGTADQHHRSASGRYTVFYNGEIYNFEKLAQGAAGTDTQVLTALHDRFDVDEIPPLLDGMYAYAVLDASARRLHLVRDVQGEKSLYIYEDAAQVIVASEPRAIRLLVPELSVDAQALRDYFRTRHLMLFERTVYDGVRQLRPGQRETLDLDAGTWSSGRQRRLRDWIDPSQMARNAGRSNESLADELDELLRRCVRQMLPVNRRYAAVVSGGVDSSLLAHYLLAEGAPDLLVAVHHVGKDRISDDLAGFERVLGHAIRVVPVDAAVYAAEIARCQAVCQAPLHTHAFIGQAVQSGVVRASGGRVLFGGDGADEFFGGYEAYVSAPAAGRFSPSPYTGHAEPAFAFDGDAPERLQADLAAAWADALDAYGGVPEPERARQAMMYCDAAHQLPEVGLRGADLMSMMWSVETRSVYLRRPIIAFALNLPLRAKTDPAAPPLRRAKPLLKHLFLRAYPEALLAEKQGFAGFPNESGAWLGRPEDFVALDVLGLPPERLAAGWADRAAAWKLINVEYFLRGRVLERVAA